MSFLPCLCGAVLAAFCQPQSVAQGDQTRAANGLVLPRVPVHSAASDLGTAYGTWAAGDCYKVSFHDGMTFVPYLGADYPHNQPWSWQTTSVTVGGVELLDRGAAPSTRHTDFRYEYRFGAVTEAYDVLGAGLEQSFVVHARPAAGDLVVRGMVRTGCSTRDRGPVHAALRFRDERGDAVIDYGAAFAIDA
ncbi:MAG: hypothetical protein KDC98_09045, partial [Planctomycetes bacterium]|nr:hypothetical protein [Planctomycetota bacterium]